MPKPNNPAGRLHSILEQALKQNHQQPSRNAWAAVFDLEPDSTGDLLYLLSQLIDQLRLTKEQIVRLENIEHELYLKPISSLEDAFAAATNLDSAWVNFRDRVKPDVMTGLAFCSDTLARKESEDTIADEVLSNLLKEVQAIIDGLSKSDITDNLKAVLIENLENVRRAILSYRCQGADGILKALDLSVGALARRRDELEPHKGDSTITRMLNWITDVDKVVSRARKAKELFGPVVGYLKDLLPGP